MATHVQTKGQEFGSGGARSLTFDNPTVTGNFIAVGIVAFKSGGAATFTVTDNFSNTYIQAPGAGATNGSDTSVYIFRAKNITGGASHQVTITPNGTCTPSFAISEFSGVDTTSPDDGGNADATSAGINASTGVITTSVAGIVIGVVSHNTATTITPNGGETQLFEDETASGTMPINMDFLSLPSGQGITLGWTLGVSASYYAAGAAFKDASGGAAGYLLVAN